MLYFFLRQGYLVKTSVQQSGCSSSSTYTLAVHRLLIFPLNSLPQKKSLPLSLYYCVMLPPHSITVKFSPVTVVNVVLLLSL